MYFNLVYKKWPFCENCVLPIMIDTIAVCFNEISRQFNCFVLYFQLIF